MSDRKRLAKLASRVPREEIEATLYPLSDSPFGYCLLGDPEDHQLICLWHETRGPEVKLIHDDALAEACKQHLRGLGARVFGTVEEFEEFAASQGWPMSAHHDASVADAEAIAEEWFGIGPGRWHDA